MAVSKCLGSDFLLLKKWQGGVKHSCDIENTDTQYSLVQKARAIVLCPKSGGRFEPLLLRTCLSASTRG